MSIALGYLASWATEPPKLLPWTLHIHYLPEASSSQSFSQPSQSNHRAVLYTGRPSTTRSTGAANHEFSSMDIYPRLPRAHPGLHAANDGIRLRQYPPARILAHVARHSNGLPAVPRADPATRRAEFKGQAHGTLHATRVNFPIQLSLYRRVCAPRGRGVRRSSRSPFRRNGDLLWIGHHSGFLAVGTLLLLQGQAPLTRVKRTGAGA